MTHLILNLIPNYVRLYKRSNMMFFFIHFHHFNVNEHFSQSMFGKNTKGEVIEMNYIKLDDLIYALYRIMDYLLPSFMLNNCQIIIELTLTKIINGRDPSTVSFSIKTKFKERYQHRFDTAQKDLIMIKEKFDLMDAELIYPQNISIKFLLNQPYTENLLYIQYILDKINDIRTFEIDFNDIYLNRIIKNEIDFQNFQKDLLDLLLSHYEPDK
jgi:hypothetical protein